MNTDSKLVAGGMTALAEKMLEERERRRTLTINFVAEKVEKPDKTDEQRQAKRDRKKAKKKQPGERIVYKRNIGRVSKQRG